MKKILITGATGFIGSQLIYALLKNKSNKIRIFIREQSNLVRLKPVLSKLEVYKGDYYNDADVDKSLKGIDTLIHLAAILSIGKKQDYKNFNINISKLFFQNALKNKVKKIIYISSMAVMGGSPYARIYNEKDTPAPKTFYSKSKLQVEQIAKEYMEKHNMNITILRAPAVYGENDNLDRGFISIIDLIAHNKFILFGSLKNKMSLIYIGNLIKAIQICMDNVKAGNKTYFVADKETLTTGEIIKLIYKLTNAKIPKFVIPKLIMKIAEFFVLNFIPSYPKNFINDMTNHYVCSTKKIQSELNWHPSFSFYQGLERTIKWYKQNG